MKKILKNAIDEKDIKKVDEIIWECRESEHHRLQQFSRTLNNWHPLKGELLNELNDIVNIQQKILSLLMLLLKDIITSVKILKDKGFDLKLKIIISRKFGSENYLKNLTYFHI